MSQAVPRSFQTTRWSLVRQATGSDDAAAQQALAALCDAYWYPIYAFIRHSGHRPHDAEDLTQGFFASLLRRDGLAAADPARGKLRTFLLACVRHHLADERDRAHAALRDERLLTSFDVAWAEERFATEPVDDLTPDRLFQRRWTLTVLEHSLELLGEEFAAEGKGELFAALRPFLGFGPEPPEQYDVISTRLGVPVGTLKSHVSRLRARWRERLFEQVAMTLDDASPETIKGELSELLTCL